MLAGTTCAAGNIRRWPSFTRQTHTEKLGSRVEISRHLVLFASSMRAQKERERALICSTYLLAN